MIAFSALALLFCNLLAAETQQDAKRAWTSADSICLRYIAHNLDDGSDWPRPGRAYKAILHSPNNKYFCFGTYGGDYFHDSDVATLKIFSSKTLKDILESAETRSRFKACPLLEVKALSNSSVEAALRLVSWSRTGEELYYVSPSGENLNGLFRIDVRTGTKDVVWETEYSVLKYEVRGKGAVVFTKPEVGDTSEKIEVGYPMEYTRRGPDGHGLQPRRKTKPRVVGIYAGTARDLNIEGSLAYTNLSPDGRYLCGVEIITESRSSVPRGWEKYSASDIKPLSAFIIVGLERTFYLEPLRSPTGGATLIGRRSPVGSSAFWSHDSSNVVLVNTCLPIVEQEQNDTRATMAYIVSVNIRDSYLEIVEPLVGDDGKIIKGVEWEREGEMIRIDYETATEVAVPSVYYHFEEGRWRRKLYDRDNEEGKLCGALSERDIKVFVRQSRFTPAQVIASLNGNECVLEDMGEQLAGIEWEPVQNVTWEEPGVGIVSGGLTLPRNAKHPLPLVIQAYHYYPELFLPDGPHRGTSDAAQVLVAHGYAVLQVDGWKRANKRNPSRFLREGPDFVERVDCAVEELVRQGIVDGTRVGMTGFSRGGYLAYYAATHPGRVRVLAAVCADSFKGDYAAYLEYGSTRTSPIGIAGNFGPDSFWQNRQGWLSRETSFNVDKCLTAIMFTAHCNGDSAQPYSWAHRQTLGAFMLNDIPVDYAFFPRGNHSLSRPRERLALINVVVDWMDFWLRDQVRSEIEASEHVRNWRRMKMSQSEKPRRYEPTR